MFTLTHIDAHWIARGMGLLVPLAAFAANIIVTALGAAFGLGGSQSFIMLAVWLLITAAAVYAIGRGVKKYRQKTCE